MKQLAFNILFAISLAWTIFTIVYGHFQLASLWIAAVCIAGYIAGSALRRRLFTGESRHRENTVR